MGARLEYEAPFEPRSALGRVDRVSWILKAIGSCSPRMQIVEKPLESGTMAKKRNAQLEEKLIDDIVCVGILQKINEGETVDALFDNFLGVISICWAQMN